MIEIICGVYGGKNGMKRPGDKPFSLSPAEEARLVARKVARYVGRPEPANEEIDEPVYEDIDAPIGFDETPPTDTEDEAEPKPLEELSRDELREVCKEYGLPYKATDSRAKLVEKITEFQNSAEDTEDEDAPVFDAAEAVQ